MGLSPFNMLGNTARNFINPEIVRDVSSIQGLASAGQVAADNIFGLFPGASLSSLKNYAFGGYGFLVDTQTGERMVFQYNTVPTDSGGAEYAMMQTLARSVPDLNYIGGKVREIKLPITFTMQEMTRDDVRRNIRWLQALAYPDYNEQNEASLSPHKVVLVMGRLYTQDVFVVRDYEIRWGDALDPISKIPSEATIMLTLLEVSTRGKSQSEVMRL